MTAPTTRNKPASLYCITKIVSRGRAAWVVGIKRQGQTVRKSFSCARDGEAAALKAAREWRDAVLKELPPMTRRQLRTVVRRNNSSGVPGVYRAEKHSGMYWVAVLSIKGQKTRTASFAVKTYGEDGARQRAIEARHRFLQEQEDRFYALSPASQALCARDFGSAEQLTGEVMPLAWKPQVALRQKDRLKTLGLLLDPYRRPDLIRRDYPSIGELWEVNVKRPDGRLTIRRFRVARYGEEEAHRLASLALAELCAQLPKSKAVAHRNGVATSKSLHR